MKNPNLNKLSVKESISITEFKNNLGQTYEKLRDKPVMVTNRFLPSMVLINAESYNDLLAYARRLEAEVKKG